MIIKTEKGTISLNEEQTWNIIDSLQLALDFDNELANNQKTANEINNILLELYKII